MIQSATARYRLVVSAVACVVLVLGLLSRSSLPFLPPFIRTYSGDVLWALLVYLLVRWLRPRQHLYRSALFASFFALGIEISQLYHAPWIDAIRHTSLGGLALGFGFVWSDLLCYACGITLGVVGEMLTHSRK